MEPKTWGNIPRQFTSDGVEIVPGLRVWNENYSRSMTEEDMDIVIYPDRWSSDDDIWFTTSQGTFNGERLSVSRPW